MRRAAGATCAAALALLLALAAPAAAESPPSLPDIEDEVMCTICGTPLEHAFSPQAERERDLIRRLIAEGRSKDEIKDALVAEYGEDVLATPDDSGFDLAAWLVPLAGLLAGLLVIVVALRRIRRGGGGARREEAAAPLDPADAARLDEDMSRLDP